MDRQRSGDSARRFADYVDRLASVMGHADRVGPLRDYCTGLMLPCERKSVEPMAAVTAPARSGRSTSRCCILSAEGGWSDERVLAQGARHGAAGDRAAAGRSRPGSSTTRAFPSRGGTRSGWRVSTVVSSASRTIARWRCRCRWPTAMRACRWLIGSICRELGAATRAAPKADVPEQIAFETKPEIALEQLALGLRAPACRAAWCCSMPAMANTELRADITALDLTYVAGILSTTTVWAPGTAPCRQSGDVGRGRPTKRLRRDAKHQPVSVKELALGLPARLAHDRMARGFSRAARLALCASAHSRRPSRLLSAPIRDRKNGC